MSPWTVLVMRALATTLPASCLDGVRVRNQVDEARVHPLERGGLRIGDVSGNVFEREGLRPHARDCGRKSTEDTHDIFSNCEPAGPPRPTHRGHHRKPHANENCCYIQMLMMDGRHPPPGKARRSPAIPAGQRRAISRERALAARLAGAAIAAELATRARAIDRFRPQRTHGYGPPSGPSEPPFALSFPPVRLD